MDAAPPDLASDAKLTSVFSIPFRSAAFSPRRILRGASPPKLIFLRKYIRKNRDTTSSQVSRSGVRWSSTQTALNIKVLLLLMLMLVTITMTITPKLKERRMLAGYQKLWEPWQRAPCRSCACCSCSPSSPGAQRSNISAWCWASAPSSWY